MIDRIVVVTRETRLEGLLVRYGTKGQARFHLERGGGEIADYVDEHETYRRAVERVTEALALDVPVHVVDRSLVPTYVFTGSEAIVAVGQDGLVANVARYVGSQPIVGVNPDPARFDGVLLPFSPAEAGRAVDSVLREEYRARHVTLAEAVLQDGQRLTAFNDLFIGARSHVSARYRVTTPGGSEDHSSSGVIVSTGAGSTGWMSSMFNMVNGFAARFGAVPCEAPRLDWDDGRLFWAVREPFASRHSGVGMVCGFIEPGEVLEIDSAMAADGVIFGDGVERDFLRFDAGARARVGTAPEVARLVWPDPASREA